MARSGRPSSRAWLAMSEYDIPGVSPNFWLMALAIVSSSSFFCCTYSVIVYMHLNSNPISKCGRQMKNMKVTFKFKSFYNSQCYEGIYAHFPIDRKVKYTVIHSIHIVIHCIQCHFYNLLDTSDSITSGIVNMTQCEQENC